MQGVATVIGMGCVVVLGGYTEHEVRADLEGPPSPKWICTIFVSLGARDYYAFGPGAECSGQGGAILSAELSAELSFGLRSCL